MYYKISCIVIPLLLVSSSIESMKRPVKCTDEVDQKSLMLGSVISKEKNNLSIPLAWYLGYLPREVIYYIVQLMLDDTLAINLGSLKQLKVQANFSMPLAYSPDGKCIGIGTKDRTACILDTKTEEQLLVLTGHTEVINALAYSPDGMTILTGSKDMTARLWDAKSGKELYTLSGHTASVTSVAYSPDGKTALTGSYDGTTCLWDVDSGKRVCTLKDGEGMVKKVVYSPDGTSILTGSDDGIVHIWRADLPSDVEKWVVEQMNPLQAWLIFTASQAKRAYGIGNSFENVFEQDVLKNMPLCVQRYLYKWYPQKGKQV